MTPKLETRNLTKRFGACTSVDKVSVSFAPGRIHAVLGENGAGKSTLMRLLFGLHTPSSGEILVNERPVVMRSSLDAIAHGIGMVQQHFTLVETLSVIDNITLGAEVCSPTGKLNRKSAIARLESLLPSPQLALPWHQRVSTLSVGQKQRVEILKLLFRDARVLFLDEPTAVLTPSEIDDFFSVLKKLKEQGRTVVLITHKINEVMELCDTYTILRAGRMVGHGEVKASSVEQIVASMIGRNLPGFPIDRSAVGAKSALEVRLPGVSLRANTGEIVGIAGIEGSGQTELVESILGLRTFIGSIHLLGEALSPLQPKRVRALGTGLIPEDRLHQGLWLEESCFNNMILGLEERFIRHQVFQQQELRSTTAQWAQQFDVRAESLDVPVRSLSGGNQQKVIFAREVSGREPRFLICHQPTRGVDLGAIDLIHRELLRLRGQGVSTLLISSELDELFKLSDRIYVLFSGKIVAEFPRAEFSAHKVGAAMTGGLGG